jgi:hypothetical protein
MPASRALLVLRVAKCTGCAREKAQEFRAFEDVTGKLRPAAGIPDAASFSYSLNQSLTKRA